MNWLRTIPSFVRLLVVLFSVAQFAGVVSSPRANAQPARDALASHTHHQHVHEYGDEGKPHHHDQAGNLADTCCALHAYFAGVLPAATAIETRSLSGEALAARPDDQALGVPPG